MKNTSPFLALPLTISLLSAAVASSTATAADESVPAGQRIFTCGHSFHVFTYQQVAEIARLAGITDHQLVGISSIGGSRVIQHWKVPDEKNAAKAALRAGKVDLLTLSPIWLPDEGIENFVKLGLAHQPDLRVTVQEYWLPNDEYVPVYPLQTKKPTDHNATDLAKLRADNARYAKDIEDLVRGINQRAGKNAVVVVPVGLAASALREKIAAGEAPGLKDQWSLFRDPWGHALAPLQMLSSYCHFAVIYRRSPVGLPRPSAFKSLTHMSQADQEKLNHLLQELAWEAVSTHPMTGLTSGTKP